MLFELKKMIGFWLMPLPFCLLAMLAGLVLLRFTRRGRIGRALFIGGFGLLLLLSNGLVSRALIRPLESRFPSIPELVSGRPLPADLAACRFVVVLGGGNGQASAVSANNLLSASARARIVEGVRLVQSLPDARLVVSGPADGAREPHATVLGRTALALGVAPDRIMYVDQARDTEAEALAVARTVNGARVALVTSAWHLPRAAALFRGAGVDILPCPADFTAHADDPWQWEDLFWRTTALERSTLAVRERLGFTWSWLRRKT